MIIGHGMIASRFVKYAADENRLLFASGVSNSANTHEEAFKREVNLLETEVARHPHAVLIYFSTCSIYDPSLQSSAYVLHKLNMEKIIRHIAKNFLIFRVSNPVGYTSNTNTLINYFITKLQANARFTVWKSATRNLIDLDDMFKVCELIINDKTWLDKTVNIANPFNYPVPDIIATLEQHFSIKGIYDIIETGNSPQIDTSAIRPLYEKLGIKFDGDYLTAMLNKYYPRQ